MCNLMIEFNQRGRELVTHGADVRVRLMKHASSYSMVTRMTTVYVLKTNGVKTKETDTRDRCFRYRGVGLMGDIAGVGARLGGLLWESLGTSRKASSARDGPSFTLTGRGTASLK